MNTDFAQGQIFGRLNSIEPEIKKKGNLQHGHSSGGKCSRTYYSWRSMITRCTLSNTKDYKDYGGRGITFCDRWKLFNNFIADMGERPDGLQLDRIDVNGNYEKDNCRWVSCKENSRNKRNNNRVSFMNQVKTLSEWSEYTGIAEDTLWRRLFTSKWTVEKSLTTPSRKWVRHNG